MKKNSIIQFVGFITNLELTDFFPKWELYAKRLISKDSEPQLFEKEERADPEIRKTQT